MFLASQNILYNYITFYVMYPAICGPLEQHRLKDFMQNTRKWLLDVKNELLQIASIFAYALVIMWET